MRDVVTFVVVLLVTTVIGLYTTMWWAEFATLGRTFSGFSTFGFWWSPIYLLVQLDEFVLLFLASAVLIVIASFHRPVLTGLLFGIAFTSIRLAQTTNWFSPEADLNDYFWAYSEHFISPIGALLGAIAGTRIRSFIRGSADT